MSAFIPVIWSGLLAAAIMALFLVEVEKLGWAKSDMFWTIGSIFSQSKKKARAIGLTVHALAGVAFAVIYVMIWSVFSPLDYNSFIKAGILTGAIHGVAVAFSLIVMVAGSKKGFNVVMTQVTAHTLFGLVLGAIVGLLENRYESVTGIAAIVSKTTGF
jgi:uncharacterized membrane protein YagU involved in acid resistance